MKEERDFESCSRGIVTKHLKYEKLSSHLFSLFILILIDEVMPCIIQSQNPIDQIAMVGLGCAGE